MAHVIGFKASYSIAAFAITIAFAAGCGTLNQPTMNREGDFALGLGTTTRIEIPAGSDTNVSQGGEAWLRYALLDRVEVYGQASFPDLGFHVGGKSLLVGDFELFDDHSEGLLLAVDGRVGYWPKGHPQGVGDNAYDASLSVPIGYAWSPVGFVSAAPSMRLGWASGSLENHELGVAIGFAQSLWMGHVALPPIGLELYAGRELQSDAWLALVRASVQLPVF